MSIQYSEQEQLRREALHKLREAGIDPYPAAEYPVNSTAKELQEATADKHADFAQVFLAGRIMTRRIMGNASFAELQDATGRIQLYFKRDDICPGEDKSLYNNVFKKLLDIGDIIGVKGYLFNTQTGEPSIHVEEFTVLSKSLRPLPVVKRDEDGNTYDAFTDAEQRFRQRYVDLLVNPQVKETFIKRSKLISTMRSFLNERGYLEVETPILQPIHGGAAARPFVTHHNTLDMQLYLRIANELYLKRLIVGGFDGVFEFAKDFRNEGMDRTHNPEFTQIELYVAYKDYNWMMNLTEEMVEKVALAVHGDTKVPVGENIIDFKRPWKRYTMFEAIEEYTGVNIDGMDETQLREVAKKLAIELNPTMGAAKIIDEIFGEKVENLLIQPTFITDYPVEMSPLTKKHRTKTGLVERFEAICNGKEICNAYSELNDPIDQRERFEDQLKLKERGDVEAMEMDEDFLRALEYGMPPTAGIGIGIDRLTMIMTNNASIQEVLFFPQMRPERKLVVATAQDFIEAGIPEVWVNALQKMGFQTVEALKAGNPNKVFNDLGGMRKKMKIESAMPPKEEVMAWFA